MNEGLIIKVESVKNMLVAHATGQFADNNEYQILRQQLIKHPRITTKLPRFVHSCRNLSEFWGLIKSKFGTYHERRDFIRQEFEPLLDMLEGESNSPSDVSVTLTVAAVSSSNIQEVWRKALERRTSDPEGAITAARTLLETVCKHILDACLVSYDDGADLPKLYAITAKQLKLSPSQHSEQIFKQILGGCQGVVEGLGALRNRHSDAHGKGISGVKPSARHAELAVNLSGTMSTFLLQTWEARKTS